nr:hypothetical protein [Tanacetum cinerariifolium]
MIQPESEGSTHGYPLVSVEVLRQHGRMIHESVKNGPLLWPTVEENGVTRQKKYSELSATEAIQADCDERIQMLIKGTSLTKQESECKLYDEFDKFAYTKGESLLEENGVTRQKKYSELSATEAIQSDCDVKATNIILQGLPPVVYALLEQFQVNTKFLNTLPPEWSKFVSDFKLVRDLHTTNVDQLHAYLGQHEYQANEYASQAPSSTPLSITYLANDFQSSVNHNMYNPSSLIPQVEYAPAVHQQSDFSQPDTGLVVPVFQKGDDPIDAINHMMSFLIVVVTSWYPPTNKQLRTSSNPYQ